MPVKKCHKCGLNRDLSDFHKDKRMIDGRVSRCKSCIAEYTKAHYQSNSDKHKEYNILNLESRISYHKKYRKENRQHATEYIRERRRKDHLSRIKNNLSKRLWSALTYTGNKKLISSSEIIGCDIEFLKLHIESKFLPGMTWENYGRQGWHVDHIKPCDSFNLSIFEEQKECFNYTNLQPLWAIDNIKKSNKIIQ